MSPADLISRLDPAARDATLIALDAISRPLDVRDLDLAFAKADIPRSQRRPMIRALLASFDVIALEPKR